MKKRPLEGPLEPPRKTKKELQAIEREKARLEREAAQRARREALALEKQQRDAQRDAQREAKEQERKAAREAKEQERKAAREAKEQERQAAREAKEQERRAAREAKEQERAREQERTAARARAQPGLGAFFSIKKQEPAAPPPPTSEYESTFLSYHLKANCELADPRPPRSSPADSLAWLRAQPRYSRSGSPCPRHIQLYETVRPAFQGTLPKCAHLARLRLEPWAPLLELEYTYDSDLEWAPGEEDDEDLMGDDPSEEEQDANSDMGSFLASDDEGPLRKRAIVAAEPMVRWNAGGDLSEFAVRLLAPRPVAIGEFKPAKPMAPQKTQTELPEEALAAILKGVQGHTGTKALLLESLYHNLHKDFALLTRSGLKAVLDQHAKRDKTGWVVDPEMVHLL